MGRACHHDEILVLAGREFVAQFIVPYKGIPAHGGEQYRDSSALDRTGCRVVGGAVVNAVLRTGQELASGAAFLLPYYMGRCHGFSSE